MIQQGRVGIQDIVVWISGFLVRPRRPSRSALMHFREYQRKAMATLRPHSAEADLAEAHLLGLVTEVAAVADEHRRHRRDGRRGWSKVRIREEIGDALWYLAALADDHQLDLADIAAANLDKVARRWLPTVDWYSFDTHLPESERLPRQITYEFRTHRRPDGVPVTLVHCDGKQVGDPVTDACHNPDGYRLHDVLHLSHAALLGWSPVTRALLRCKRRSDPVLDENEDGGRAIAIEEGLTARIFGYAATRNYLRGAHYVDGAFLTAVTADVGQLEVGIRTAADWENTILTGFRMWNALHDHDGSGAICADLDNRSMAFHPLGQ
jgi:NTP pyrophosphatase (non-canonical NTP hydrolase)